MGRGKPNAQRREKGAALRPPRPHASRAASRPGPRPVLKPIADFMTDATPPASTNGDQPTQGQPAAPGFRILAQYVRDLSFENPRAPESLRFEGQPTPTRDLGVEMNASGRKDGLFEVELKLTFKATNDSGVLFNVELAYGGLFQLIGVAERDVEPMLLIECPRYLYPFAREIIARCTSDGGFPPVLLDPIDFAAIYAQRRQEMERAPAQA